MPSFDPNAEEHKSVGFVDAPGTYIMMVSEFYRRTTQRGDAAITATCEVISGEKKGAKLRRMYMLEGRGTSWFAELMRSVRAPILSNYMDDMELSQAIGMKAFLGVCGNGQEKTNAPGEFFIELKAANPLPPGQLDELRRARIGLGTKGNIVVDAPANQGKRPSPPRGNGPSSAASGFDDDPNPDNWANEDIPF